MNPNYDECLEQIWTEGTASEMPSRTEKREAVLKHFKDSKWHYDGLFISQSNERRYACVCSQLSNCYFRVADRDGNCLRIGSECISCFLKGKDLTQAKDKMTAASVQRKEAMKISRANHKKPLQLI